MIRRMLIVLGLALLAVPAGTAVAQGYGPENFIAVSDSTLLRGQTFTVFGCCYSGEVTVTVNSEPIVGRTTADASGNFSINMTIPNDFELGLHTVTGAGQDMAGRPLSLSTEVVVIAATDVAGPVTAGPGSCGGLARSGAEPLGLIQLAVVLIGAGLVLCERQRRANRRQAHTSHLDPSRPTRNLGIRAGNGERVGEVVAAEVVEDDARSCRLEP